MILIQFAVRPALEEPLHRMTPSNAGAPAAKTSGAHFGRYIVIGFFTVAPLWVTWLVVDFVFSLLARTGAPVLRGVAVLRSNSSSTRFCRFHDADYGLTGTNASEYS